MATRGRPKLASRPSNSELATLWQRYQNQPVAADAIYSTLREAILRGVLAPGEHLGEIQLASLFNRSRTPIREAILRLESERLAARSSRRGFAVGKISREEILEVYAVREVLDGLAARLAAQGMFANELEHLVWLNNRLRAAAEQGNASVMASLNIEFHEEVGRASRNTMLLQFMRQIHDWVRRFHDSTFSFPGRAGEAVAEHDALLEALGRRDPDAAERIARHHMARAMQVRISMQQSVSREF